MDGKICLDCDRCGLGLGVELYVRRVKPDGCTVRVMWGTIDSGRLRSNLGRYSRKVFCPVDGFDVVTDKFLSGIIIGTWSFAISNSKTIVEVLERCPANINCPFYTEHCVFDLNKNESAIKNE